MRRIAALFLAVCLLLAACSGGDIAPSDAVPASLTVEAPVEPTEPVFHNRAEEHREELDQALAQIASDYGVLGCSAALFEHDQVVYRFSEGTAVTRPVRYQDSGKTAVLPAGTPATNRTKYRVASLSKLATMLLAMQQVDAGTLSLDSDAAELLDERLQNPAYPEDHATLERLLSHTSGIIDGAGYVQALNRPQYPPLSQMLQYGNNFSGNRPGEACCYSNFGMGLVAGMVEHATGKHFYDQARDALFEPLGLDAAFLTDYIAEKESIAGFADFHPLSWGSLERIYSRFPVGEMYLLGQGELYISAEDMAKLAILLAGDGTYEGARYLSEEALEEIHRPRAREEETGVLRGLAVQINDDLIEGVTLYGHQGNAYGAVSCVFYDRERQCGVVFLTNGAAEGRAENGVYQVNEAVVRAVWPYLAPEEPREGGKLI